MSNKVPLYARLFTLALFCMGCDLNPPVHVTLNISDPLQVAGSSQRFAIHLGTLTQECPTSEDCKIKTLEDCDLSDTSNKQSCQEE